MGREKEPQAEISRRQFIRAMTVGAAAQILSGADGAYNLLKMPENNGKPGDGRVSFGIRLIGDVLLFMGGDGLYQKGKQGLKDINGNDDDPPQNSQHRYEETKDNSEYCDEEPIGTKRGIIIIFPPPEKPE